MSDNVSIKDSSGTPVAVAADQVVDGVLGTVEVQYVKIMDGTLDGTNKVGATSNGLSVDLRSVAVFANTGNITTSSTSIATDVTIFGHAVIVLTGTYAGINAAFEASIDNGVTYFAVQGARSDGTAVETTTGVLGNTTRAWEFNCASYTHLRIRSTAYTSGTGAVTVRVSILPTEPVISANVVNASIPVTESGTWTVQPGNTANTTPWLVAGPIVDNAAFTDGTTRVQPMGFIFDEVAGTALTENDAGAARMDSKRAVVIAVEDATTRGQRLGIDASGRPTVNVNGTVPISDGGGSITVDGSVNVAFAVASTPAQTSVAGSASSVNLLASNASRKGATVFNDSSATLYLKLGATASTTSYSVMMTPNAYFEIPYGYTGTIDGIWTAAAGNARITELT